MDLKERNQGMKDFFDGKANDYDDNKQSSHLKKRKNKSAIIEELKNNIETVLDLGAGTGLELIPLFEKFPNTKVTAIDISDNMLEELKGRSFANKVKTICGDFFELDFGCNYDAVISSAALHHFNEKDKKELYTKIYECLKNDGQFINSDRFVDTQEEQDRLMKEYEETPNLYPHMDTPLTTENEKRILNEIGFKNIKIGNLEDERYKLLIATK